MLRNNTVSRADLGNDRNRILDIHYGDVLIRYGAVIDVSTLEGPSISITDNRFLGDRLTDGDIIMADTAEDANAGKCVEIEGLMQRNVVAGLHTIPLRPVALSGRGYWGQYLNSASFRDQLLPKMQGTKVVSLSRTTVVNATVRYPSLPEQRCIGEFFTTLDSLIAAAERQEDLLKQKKQAYLQLMFPQGGENEPRLRFAGFSGEWEQRRFGEIFQYERPDAYLAGDDEIEDEGAIPVLTANKAFILGYTNSFQGIYQKGRCIIFDDFTLDSKRVEHPFKVRSSAIKILTVRENMDFDFAFELLRTSKFPLLGHARHYITVVQPQAALIPHSLQEQQHIGRFFRNFDSLIAAAEKRAASLRALKSAYLQRMFV